MFTTPPPPAAKRAVVGSNSEVKTREFKLLHCERLPLAFESFAAFFALPRLWTQITSSIFACSRLSDNLPSTRWKALLLCEYRAYRSSERFHCSRKQLIGAKHSFVLAEHTSHRFHDKQTSAEVANRERNWNTFADQFTVDSPLQCNYSLFSPIPTISDIFLLCCLFTRPPLPKWVFDEAKWLRKSCEQKKAQTGWRDFSSVLYRHAVCLL